MRQELRGRYNQFGPSRSATGQKCDWISKKSRLSSNFMGTKHGCCDIATIRQCRIHRSGFIVQIIQKFMQASRQIALSGRGSQLYDKLFFPVRFLEDEKRYRQKSQLRRWGFRRKGCSNQIECKHYCNFYVRKSWLANQQAKFIKTLRCLPMHKETLENIRGWSQFKAARLCNDWSDGHYWEAYHGQSARCWSDHVGCQMILAVF